MQKTSGKIRILFICPQLTTGGAERQLLYLCKYLDSQTFEKNVVYYEEADHVLAEIKKLDVSVLHFDRSKLGVWGVLRAIRREIQCRYIQVLDCRLPSGYRFGRLAGWKSGVSVIIAQERTVWPGSRIRVLLDRVCNRWTDGWIGNSQSVCRHIARDIHVPENKIHLLYNGTEIDHFRSAVVHPFLLELKKKGRRIILNIGRLEPSKNQILFLRVCCLLKERFADLDFVLSGDGNLRKELEAYSHTLGLSERCHFMGLQSDIASILAGSDVFVQTSDFEGLPNAVIEAMCAGVPVVATDAGGTREIVQDGINGFLVQRDDEKALVDRISMFLSNLSIGKSMGIEGFKYISEHFSNQSMAEQYKRIILRLMEKKKIYETRVSK